MSNGREAFGALLNSNIYRVLNLQQRMDLLNALALRDRQGISKFVEAETVTVSDLKLLATVTDWAVNALGVVQKQTYVDWVASLVE